MKVILLKDIPKVGQKDDILEVKSGYALNFLIPNGFAIAATKEKERKIFEEKESTKEEEQKEIERLQKELAELSKSPIKIKAKANEQGHLFAAISLEDIISATGKNIPEKVLNLKEEIKEVEEREVEAKVGDKSFKLKAVVEAV